MARLTAKITTPFDWANAGYLQWHYEADRRHKAGQRQSWCVKCGLWRWPDEECCDGERITQADFKRREKQLSKSESTP